MSLGMESTVPQAPARRRTSQVDGERLAALIDLAARATPRELLFAATREITELLGERGSCILVEGGPRVALAPHAPTVIDRPIDLGRYPEIQAAMDRRDVIAIDDVRSDARLDSVRGLLPRELGSVVTVPLVAGDRCLGVVLVQSRQARAAEPEGQATAALMARLAALVLARSGSEPSQLAEALVAPPAAVTEAPRLLTPERILVVEDDADHAAVLAEVLEEEGYLVERARDGADGLRRATVSRPDLVLLDVNLPVLDGFATAEQLRQAPQTRHVPILFLSGSGDLPTRVRTVQLDDVDFLPKPYLLAELLTRTQRALNQAAARNRLRAEAEHDELTGLANLRLLRARMASERSRFERYGTALSLVVVDVDKLKGINDRHGHVAGNLALRCVADVLRREVRETDLAVRYGGDEFVVLLPHTTLGEGLAFAHRTRSQIERLEPGSFTVTVSIGVASLSRRGTAESNDDLLHRADSAAYLAKRRGGNQVCGDASAEEAPWTPAPSAIDDGPIAD